MVISVLIADLLSKIKVDLIFSYLISSKKLQSVGKDDYIQEKEDWKLLHIS